MAGATALAMVPLHTSPAMAACLPTTWTIWAGQTKNVGTVGVTNDAEAVYVTYTMTVPGYFGTLHLWVGDDLLNLPRNNPGNPEPGQFPWQFTPPDLTTTTYTFKIPLASLGMSLPLSEYCNKTFYVVAHCEVNYLDDAGNPAGGDTGFAGDVPGNSGNRWWFYGVYAICCDITIDPPTPPKVNTAFAKGVKVYASEDLADHFVFTTDPKSNPEKLPSLNLIKNRWGWAIHLRDNAEHEYPLWAGCGLNKTGSGKKVGKVLVQWDGTQVFVKYLCFAGPAPTANAFLREVHVYAGDFKPTTMAPGQYGTGEYFDPPRRNWDTFVNAEDSNGDGVWIIAHAVVQY
jgi:hypothetical protein